MEIMLGIFITLARSWRIARNIPDCPDCGFWVACDDCSKRMDEADRELDK